MGKGGNTSPCTKYCEGCRCRVLLHTNKFCSYLQKLVVGDGAPAMH